MEVSAEDIIKIIEDASGLRDILSKKEEINTMIEQLKSLKDVTTHFKSVDELSKQVSDIETKLYTLKTYLTSEEAARYLTISKYSILEAVKRGELHYYSGPCKGYHFTKDDLDQWFSQYKFCSNTTESFQERAANAALKKRKRNAKKD